MSGMDANGNELLRAGASLYSQRELACRYELRARVDKGGKKRNRARRKVKKQVANLKQYRVMLYCPAFSLKTVKHVPIQYLISEGSKSEAFPSCFCFVELWRQKDLRAKSHLPKRMS